MKLIKSDRKKGIVTVKPENTDDLWSLSELIEPGDLVKGKTQRKIKVSDKETMKKMLFLSINVEQVEFTENALRINGKTIEDNEDVAKGSYHSFEVEPGIPFTIEKEWLDYQWDKLIEATKEQPSKILIIVFDRESAIFAKLKRQGYEIILSLQGEVVKKRVSEKPKQNFYQQIITKIKEYDEKNNYEHIILGSPSFWREELMEQLKDEKLKQKIAHVQCSGADEPSIKEVLKKGELEKVLKQDRISKELKLVEELFVQISKEELAVYGFEDVKKAVELGAVDTLLITDELIKQKRQNQTFNELQELMRSTEKMKGKITIISTTHEGGKKLQSLTGIAAILRYEI